MNDRNNQPEDDATLSTDDQVSADVDAENAVVNDMDVPVHPDESTIAQTEAAYNAVHYSKPDTRKYRGPRSIALLLLVILGIVGLGVYAVIWSDNLRQKNERIHLRVLEERHEMSTWQQRNTQLKQEAMDRAMPGMKLKPANSEYKPLNPQEKANYDALLKQYGRQFEPSENQKTLIEETKKLLQATRPAG